MSTGATEQELGASEWIGEMGDRWARHYAEFEAMLAPVNEALMRAAAFRPGETVVDVGCGAGGTSLEIAGRVGPEGRVLGLDVSPQLVELAERRAKEAGVANVRFRCDDAATADLGPERFDRLFSRVGVMFFDDPYGAFANMRRFLKDSGGLVMACWAPPAENPWYMSLGEVMRRFVDLPAPPPRAPGPFALSEPDYFRDILSKAGFVEIGFETWRGVQRLGGGGPAEARRFMTEALPFGAALDELDPGRRAEAYAALEEMLAGYVEDGGVALPAAAFLITAKAS